MKRQPTAVQSKWVTALKVCVWHVHIKSQMFARGSNLITIIGSKLQNKCERVQKGSLPCSVWHPCQSHSPDVLLSILSNHPNTFGLTIIYLFFFFSVLSISTLTLSHKRGQITVLMFDLKGKKEEVVAVLSVNLKLSWRHFILFYFFLILQPDSKKQHLLLRLHCFILKWHFFQVCLRSAAGDAPRLDAVFSAHPGESFHTAEKLLHAFFRQEQLECTGASDFPCERLMIGLIWRGFMDYGALEFSENRFARWKELSLGAGRKKGRTSGAVV